MNRNDKSFDEAFDMLLTKAAILADENIGKNLQEPEENIVFSKEHEQKMRKLFKYEQRKLFEKRVARYSMRCACVLLAVVVVTSVSIFSVDAWRMRFLDFVMKSDEPNTDYHLDGGEASSYSDNGIGLEYIPNGFTITQDKKIGKNIFLEFKSQEQYFILTIQNADGLSNVDTEGALVEELTLNGRDAIFVDRGDIRFVLWGEEQNSYTLHGNISKDELIKIAENVQIDKRYF